MNIYKKIFSREYIELFFVVILILLFRMYIIEPFRIPTESMKPTLLIGDFIFANKFIYKINVPLSEKYYIITYPKRGDIIVFYKGKKNYVKRLIGIPNDVIVYKNKKLYINKINIKKKRLYIKTQVIGQQISYLITFCEFLTPQRKYFIKNMSFFTVSLKNDYLKVLVPNNKFFLFGDNRDNSEDSRFWGGVDMKDIRAKVLSVWLSLNISKLDLRWNRLFKIIL